MNYNYFKVICKRAFIYIVVLFISVFNLSFADDTNLCPGQAVYLDKYYDNIEGECSVGIYNGSTLLGTLDKSTGSISIGTGVVLTDSTTTLASPIASTIATNTLRFYSFPYPNISIKLLITCVRPGTDGNSSTSTASTSVSIRNYGDTDPNFSGKKCIDNYSVSASTSKGGSYNNNYGNNYVLDPFSGNVRCSNGASGPTPYLNYNTGATTDGTLPCTSFIPKGNIFIYSGAPSDIQYTCQQSDRYTLYFVPNKTPLQADSSGWGAPVIPTTTINTTYKSPTRAFYFDGAWTPTASKGAVRLICTKGATSTIATFDFGSAVSNNNTLASLTCSKSGLVRLYPNCTSPGDQYAFSTSSLNFGRFLPFTNGTYYNITATNTYYLRCQYSGNSATNFSIASIYAGPSDCASSSTPTNTTPTPVTPPINPCYVDVYQDGNSTPSLQPAAPASSTNARFQFVLSSGATTSCSCNVRNNNGLLGNLNINSPSYSTTTSVPSTTNEYTFETIYSDSSLPQCYFYYNQTPVFSYTEKPILIKLSANPNTIYYYGSTTLSYSIDNNGRSGQTVCRLTSSDGTPYSWSATSSESNNYPNPLKNTIPTHKIKDPTSFTITCASSKKKVNVNLYTRGDI